jgi:hypothetical protein
MTARSTHPREGGEALRTALLILVCVALAVLPFNSAAGPAGHPCDARMLSQTTGHAHDGMHGDSAGQTEPEHVADRHEDHGAPGLPGATCATCALHCSVVFAVGEGLPFRHGPARTLVALAPIAGPPGLNPAPADPPPRA